MPANDANSIHHNFGFLLLENYSAVAFTLAAETLRLANRELGYEAYRWQIFTASDESVHSSSKAHITSDATIDSCNVDTLFVCGGERIEDNWSKPLMMNLKRLARLKVNIGSLCTGAYILARSGLLDDYKATIHWENLASVREEFPRVNFTHDLYQLDRDRYTCAGGTASIDMMLGLIRTDVGAEISCRISELLICDRVRGNNDRQRTPLRMHLGTSQPKLTEAVTLMEANIEEPMSLDELSGYVGISRRQLERLFKKYLNCVPTRYYLELRLTRARQLLLQTNKSIVDVALACGFISSPHFSKCYRDFFGIPPRDERRLYHSPPTQS